MVTRVGHKEGHGDQQALEGGIDRCHSSRVKGTALKPPAGREAVKTQRSWETPFVVVIARVTHLGFAPALLCILL